MLKIDNQKDLTTAESAETTENKAKYISDYLTTLQDVCKWSENILSSVEVGGCKYIKQKYIKHT